MILSKYVQKLTKQIPNNRNMLYKVNSTRYLVS